MSKRMNDFIGRVREIVKAGGAEEEITARVAARLEPILDDPRLLSRERFVRADGAPDTREIVTRARLAPGALRVPHWRHRLLREQAQAQP